MDLINAKPRFSFLSFNPSTTKTKRLYPTPVSFFSLTSINKFKSSTVSFSYKSQSNLSRPKQSCTNSTFPLNQLLFLLPIFQSIKDLAYKQTRRWVSTLRAYTADTEKFREQHGGRCLQNGGLGVALLSVTASAKVRISPFVATLMANPTFISGLFAWFIAQSTKVFLNFFVERKWDFRLFFASGGMPSSHSALCTALTTSVALCHGVADSLFPVCLGFSSIVMYDAIGVRRHAGMQAEVLNLIVEDLFQGHPISQRKLKELLGHTPSQVLAGAVLGIMVACICCQGCLVAT